MIDGVLPASREGLQSMLDEATRLTSILNGLDELTRAESSVLNLQREHIELKAFLSAIVGRFERLFSEKHAVILLDCPDNLTLTADPDRLSQIIINLITNALKAIDVGGRVSIIATREKDIVLMEVADNGRGISEEDIPHLFERFYKGAGDGLGLGLAIVKELVAAHGGSVKVRSGTGEGARFIINFPT
jgi:two-component system sensor histidine kinase BaeS